MADGSDEENERNSNPSGSDEDSLSLLRDLEPFGDLRLAEDSVKCHSDDPVVNKGGKEKCHKQVVQVKAPEAEKSSSAKVYQNWMTPKQLFKRNGRGETHLHRVCKRGDLTQVKALIQAGISVNMEDFAGWTALHEASAFGDEAVVEELLRAGANVNARSCDGVTPLHDGVYRGQDQVVKLLLENGANASDRTLGGLSALDMADSNNIKELLLTFQHSRPGATSSEAHCSDSADIHPGEPSQMNGALKPPNISLGEKASITDYSHSEAMTLVLGEVGRRQSELSSLKDEGKGHSALIQIHRELNEVLTKQRLEKDKLAKIYRNMSHRLRQRVLKPQLVSLASCQRSLVEVLRRQQGLVTLSATVGTRPFPAVQQTPDQQPTPPSYQYGLTSSCSGGIQQKERPGTPPSPSILAPADSMKDLTGARRSHKPSGKKKAAPHSGVQRERASSGLSGAVARDTVKHISLKVKGTNSLIQTNGKDNRRRLRKLVQGGVLPAGSPLQVWLKGRCHPAEVSADGGVVSQGKVHPGPEQWLESILGNNIPVSSTYAWDKVTSGNRPLSSFLLRLNGEEQSPEEADHLHSELTSEAAYLKRLTRIKIIHLVSEEERLPNALMDRYWDKLTAEGSFESEDWASDFL